MATVDDLRALERLVKALPKEKLEQLAKIPAVQAKLANKWLPNPGPQTEAYYCEADELLYGGEAGGGKSDLLLGLALNEHRHARILRRINQDAGELGERLVDILDDDAGFSRQPPTWRRGDQFIEFRGCELEKDKQRFKGKARDFIGYDELADFLESQYVFINTWNRSVHPDQRCRIVGATNGPTTAEGMWIVKRWAAWLDPTHPNPAESGEIRWYLNIDDKDVEVDGPGPHELRARMIRATSRTFIRSRLENNPDLDDTDYGDRLEQLPEELRRVYRGGDFTVGLQDDDYQVIPTDWIMAAEKRWTPDGYKGLQMTAQGFDSAGGGKDPAALASRYGGWYAPIETVQGEETADGTAMCALIVRHRRDGCPVIVDVGGGYAGGVIERFKDNGIPYSRFDGAATSMAAAKGSGLRFANKRAEAIWRFREELDPTQEGGSAIALPPDPELRAELASYHWTPTARGILIQSKQDIKKLIGRSTNKADAVVMCLSEGNKAAARRMNGSFGRKPKAILGYANSKRR